MSHSPIINGINHITLSVGNLERSINFYTEVLDFKLVKKWQQGAYLDLNNLWLCLSQRDNPAPAADYSHIAFNCVAENFSAVKNRVKKSEARIWQENKSEGDSIYFLDPDGHQLEVHVGSLSTRLTSS